jgi:UDP-N-acetylmuramate--alanine ligase
MNLKKVKIVFSGGGTGGHFFPALNMAYELNRKLNCEILFIGSKNGVEYNWLPQTGFQYRFIPVAGFRRSLSLKNIAFPFKLWKSLKMSKNILKEFQPDLAIGTGGYVMGPVLKSAQKLKIPTILQEQNSYPGVTGRLLAPKADLIFIAYKEAGKLLKTKKTCLMGNPVKILPHKSAQTPAIFGLSTEKKTIFVCGGSQGSIHINNAVLTLLEKNIIDKKYQVLWQCGKKHYPTYSHKLTQLNLNNVQLIPFIENMSDAYHIADFVICRAGAMTLSELQVFGTPAILIPFPYAAADHQYKNAAFFKELGAALVIRDDKNLADHLLTAIQKLQNNDTLLRLMAEKMRHKNADLALTKIVDEIIRKFKLDVPSDTLKNIKKIHFTGISGAGMSALASVMAEKGYEISGSDRATNDFSEQLKNKGIEISPFQVEENITDQELLVYSSAVPTSNPEIQAAMQKNIPILKRAELLGRLVNEYHQIAIAGSHGKTTTSALLADILVNAGLDPTVIIGGNTKTLQGNSRYGNSKYCVVEADEYDRSFLNHKPTTSVLTSLEEDHLDIYKDMDTLKAGFTLFANSTKNEGQVFLNANDKNLVQISKRLKNNIFTFALDAEADYQAKNYKPEGLSTTFDFYEYGRKLGKIELNLLGKHNVIDALAAASVSRNLEVPLNVIQETLSNFKGVERRGEILGIVNEITIIDDYAHHPSEIEAIITAVVNLPKKRLIIVFQPHLYSRTKEFYKQFAAVLMNADIAIIAKIYPARELPIEGVSAKLIDDEMKRQSFKNSWYLENKNSIADLLEGELKAGDILLVLGAGDINLLSKKIFKRLKEKYE